MTQTITGLSGVIKRLWPQTKIERMFYGKCPLWGMIPKDTNAEGSPIRLAIQYARGGGRSADFTSAQTYVQPTAFEGFDLTTVDNYQLFQITTKAIRAAKTNKGALVHALNNEIKSKLQNLKEDMCYDLYSDGSGQLGRIASGTGTATLTMYAGTDMRRFKVGDTLVSSANADMTSASTNVGRIGSINRAARTITINTGTWHGDFDDDDYVAVVGDATAKLPGLPSWLPAAAPGATSFYGVNRTTDIETLGGRRYTASLGTDDTIVGAVMNAADELHDYGSDASALFVNTKDFTYMQRFVEDQTIYRKNAVKDTKGTPIAHVGYGTLRIETSCGTVDVYSDSYCPRGRAYLLDMSSWKAFSYGPMPGWLNEDKVGNILRVYNADSYEGRFGAYWVLGCEAPGHNMTIDISAVNGSS